MIAVMIPVLMTDAAYSHYFAPAAAPAYFLIAASAQRVWERGSRPLGRRLLIIVVVIASLDMGTPLRQLMRERGDWAVQRAELLETLRDRPGSDLVFVHYPPGYDGIREWVYNRADIDAAPVVWARSLQPALDAEVVKHFRGHRVWDVSVGDTIVVRERP